MVYYQVSLEHCFSGRLEVKLATQAGIGTYTAPQMATPFMTKFSKVSHSLHTIASVLEHNSGNGPSYCLES